jgi:hypothetical protein
MPLFNESLESIAQAVVTVKRALKAGAIEKENYKGLSDYLAQRVKDFKIKKTHIAKANKDLDDELEAEVEEFFMDEGDALCKMAEELLEEHEKDLGKDDDELLRAEQAEADDWDKQAAACKAWMKMDDEERVAMAALARGWVEGNRNRV